MNEINLATVSLNWDRDYEGPPAPHLLRGAVAAQFPENDLFHQHDATDQLVYRYPRVHYRWQGGSGVIAGFGDGAESLVRIPWAGLELRLGKQHLSVIDAHTALRRHAVAPTESLARYRFCSPWLPLNQKNFERYRAMDRAERELERDRLAVAGILMALKGLGIRFGERLFAAFECQGTVPCTYKAQKLMGFRGTLVANADLPDDIAIGKAVSHGYGWLVRA